MSIEQNKITNMQLVFILTGLIQGSILLTAYITPLTKQNSYLVIMSSFIIMIPYAIVYGLLSQMYPGKNLIDIHEIVYGKYIGKLISIGYFFYFLMVLSFNIRFLGDFYTGIIMPDTPINFFMISFYFACAFTVYKGIRVLANISNFIVTLIYASIFSTFLFLIPYMDFTNFLPVSEIDINNFIQGTHILLMVPFGEIFIFLTFADNINSNKCNLTKYLLAGLVLGASCMVLISVRDTAVLGDMAELSTFPASTSIRLIEVNNVFMRMDVLIIIIQTVSMFIKTSLFYFATVICLSNILKLRNYYPFIIPIGAIALFLAITDWESSAEALTYARLFIPFLISPFLHVLPPITLLIGKIRSKKTSE